jgi:hypothetical protein
MDLKIVRSIEEVPEGAQRCHLYNARDMLRPRGPMKKESIGLYVKDRLHGAFESWTNSEYGDSIEPGLALCVLHQNMMEEINAAFNQFANEAGKEHPDALAQFIQAMHG